MILLHGHAHIKSPPAEVIFHSVHMSHTLLSLEIYTFRKHDKMCVIFDNLLKCILIPYAILAYADVEDLQYL